MVTLFLIITISIFIASLNLLQKQEEVKVRRINEETKKVYCIKKDKNGKYKRGEVGYTISKVEYGKVLVSFGENAYWIPVDEVCIIEEEKK